MADTATTETAATTETTSTDATATAGAGAPEGGAKSSEAKAAVGAETKTGGEAGQAAGAEAGATGEPEKAGETAETGKAGHGSLLTRPEETAEGEGEAGEAGKGEGEGAGAADKPALDITLPEGVELDKALLEAFTPIAEQHGLKTEGAQALVDLYVAQQERWAQAQVAEEARRVEGWAEAAAKDEELRGAFGEKGFDSAIAGAKSALAQWGTPELVAAIDETGFGSHPEFIRILARIHKATREDTVAGAASGAGGTETEDEYLRRTYPSMFKQRG